MKTFKTLTALLMAGGNPEENRWCQRGPARRSVSMLRRGMSCCFLGAAVA